MNDKNLITVLIVKPTNVSPTVVFNIMNSILIILSMLTITMISLKEVSMHITLQVKILKLGMFHIRLDDV